MDGRTNVRTDGRTDGRAEGRKAGRPAGRVEGGREQRRKAGRQAGRRAGGKDIEYGKSKTTKKTDLAKPLRHGQAEALNDLDEQIGSRALEDYTQ